MIQNNIQEKIKEIEKNEEYKEKNAIYKDFFKRTHLIIAGCTGSGKSIVLKNMLNIAEKELDEGDIGILLIDLKRTELTQFKDNKNIWGVETERWQAKKALNIMTEYMNETFKKMEEERISKSKNPHTYIIIDEFAQLITNPKNLKQDKEVLKPLMEILRLGRAANIHVILATQSPQREVIPAVLVQNFDSQLALRCKSEIESKQIIGVAGAENLSKYGMHGYGLYYKPEYDKPKLVRLPLC